MAYLKLERNVNGWICVESHYSSKIVRSTVICLKHCSWNHIVIYRFIKYNFCVYMMMTILKYVIQISDDQ